MEMKESAFHPSCPDEKPSSFRLAESVLGKVAVSDDVIILLVKLCCILVTLVINWKR